MTSSLRRNEREGDMFIVCIEEAILGTAGGRLVEGYKLKQKLLEPSAAHVSRSREMPSYRVNTIEWRTLYRPTDPPRNISILERRESTNNGEREALREGGTTDVKTLVYVSHARRALSSIYCYQRARITETTVGGEGGLSKLNSVTGRYHTETPRCSTTRSRDQKEITSARGMIFTHWGSGEREHQII